MHNLPPIKLVKSSNRHPQVIYSDVMYQIEVVTIVVVHNLHPHYAISNTFNTISKEACDCGSKIITWLPNLQNELEHVIAYQLKHRREYNMEIKSQWHGRETTIARGEAEYYIWLEPKPKHLYLHIVQV